MSGRTIVTIDRTDYEVEAWGVCGSGGWSCPHGVNAMRVYELRKDGSRVWPNLPQCRNRNKITAIIVEDQ